MTDRPIIFSAPMVRALIEGRKTQTRRALKPPYGTMEWLGNGHWRPICTKFFPGDRLYVREAHALVGNVDPPWVIYRASGYDQECIRLKFSRPVPPEESIRWRPSIHMPRWASRLTLTVTEVRVQRLQEISEADAVAEGVESDSDGWKDYQMPWTQCATDPAQSYRTLWNSLHGPDAWDENPWVVAVPFTVRQGNIDA